MFWCFGGFDLNFSKLLNQKATNIPSGQHVLNEEYYKRIEAIQFTMNHDDGNAINDVEKSDIILLGVSRTSKTPTSIYLANRGYKTSNIPIVNENSIPEKLKKNPKAQCIIGLVADAKRLHDVRKNRLVTIKENENINYTKIEKIEIELDKSKKTFQKYQWPTIDVTRKSVEETAASIIKFMKSTQIKSEIILASKSKVRKEILEKNNINCRVISSNVEEDPIKQSLIKEGATPELISKNLAEIKATKVSSLNNDFLVLGADSVIDLENNIISKPENRIEALEILKKLNGKEHYLISSVTIAKNGAMIWNYTDKAKLKMKHFNLDELKKYLSKISDHDLFSYNVYQIEGEGKNLFSNIDGDKDTIMGLPIKKIKDYLERI